MNASRESVEERQDGRFIQEREIPIWSGAVENYYLVKTNPAFARDSQNLTVNQNTTLGAVQ